jgi:hypothetical protein
MESLRDRYERAVRALAVKAKRMTRAGADVETVARAVHANRRALAENYKALTPEPLRSAIYNRTLSVYRNAAGPTIEYLRSQGKTWEQIIEGAVRPGPKGVPDSYVPPLAGIRP